MQKKEEKIREYLKRLNMTEIFACLDEKDIAGLSLVNYKKGEYLFHAGDKIEAIFFLQKESAEYPTVQARERKSPSILIFPVEE